MMKRIVSLPCEYAPRIEAQLRTLGYSIHQPKKLADAIRALSDYFTQNPDAQSPWREDWAAAAQLAYYFPLNYARNQAVATEGLRLGFFSGLETLIDFGSGHGSALFAFLDTLSASPHRSPRTEATTGLRTSYPPKAFAIDLSPKALEMGRALRAAETESPHETLRIDRLSSEFLQQRQGNALILSSYALTELACAPTWWKQAEALAIVEPSTRQDGRRLMRYREELTEAGYQIWAPCTHQLDCPLLANSEKDWCHDRIHWQAPDWLNEIETYLPMKNHTLTFSYLLARKSISLPASLNGYGRLVGDMLIEKGKTRQALCRGPEKEFLTWFPQRMKDSKHLRLERGDLIKLEGPIEKKSNEVRIKTADDIRRPASDPF